VRQHIAIVTPGTFAAATDRASSVERVVAEMAGRLPQDRFRVTVYSARTGGAPQKEVVGGVVHRRIGASSRASYMRQVIRSLRREKPDLVQIDNRPYAVRIVRRGLPGVPVILSLHSTTFVRPHIYGQKTVQTFLNAADRIIVNSKFLKGWLRTHYKLKEDSVHVCYPGVDEDRFADKYTGRGREQAEQLRAELGYREKKIILYMGRLIPIKGVHLLLDAMPSVIARHDDAVLVICGSARYGSDRLTPYVKRLHRQGNTMPRHVRFVPFVPHSLVPHWYQAADVAVVPSVGDEAFGLVNAEALACGTPVVALRSGGIGEIIEHGISGRLIEPQGDPHRIAQRLVDEICGLLDDRGERERLGRRGMRIVQDAFTWKHAAAAYAEVYESCLRAAGRMRSRGR